MAKQDNQAPDRDVITQQFVGVVMDDAWRIRFELYNEDADAGPIGLFPRRRANREALRGFVSQGYLTPEQVEEVNELYPLRQRSEEEAEEAPENAGESPENTGEPTPATT